MAHEQTGLTPEAIGYDDLIFDAPIETGAPQVEVDDRTKQTPNEDPETSNPETDPTPTGEEGSTDPGTETDDEGQETEVEEDFTLAGELAKRIGIELDPQSSYSDDWEGLAQMFTDLVPKQVEQVVQERYGAHPDALKYLNYLEQGGDPTEYFQTMHPDLDYSKIEIPEDAVQTQEDLVRTNLQEQGLKSDSIKKMIDAAKAGGNLSQMAEIAREALAARQERNKRELSQAIEDAKAAALAERQQLERDVDTILHKGVVENLQIPVPDRQELKKYLFDPLDQAGTTQYARDMSELSLSQQIFLAQLVRNKMNLPKLVQNLIKTEKAKDLKELLRQKKEPKNAGDIAPQGTANGTIDLDDLVIGNH